jgi:hypothetical protein
MRERSAQRERSEKKRAGGKNPPARVEFRAFAVPLFLGLEFQVFGLDRLGLGLDESRSLFNPRLQ